MEIFEIKEALKNSKYKAEISKATLLQAKMQFFCTGIYDIKDSLYFKEYEKFIKDRLNNEESKSTFFTHINTPFPTTSLSSKINREIIKYFHADDKNIRHVFEKETKDLSFLKKYDIEYLMQDWFQKFCESPNDLFFCHKYIDTYRIQYVKIENLLAIDFDIDNNIEYAICKISDSEILAFDKNTTAKYKYEYSNIDTIELIDLPFVHNNNHCAIDFVSSVTVNDYSVIRKNHFYDSLGDILKLQLNHVIGNIHDSMSFAHEKEYKNVGCGVKLQGAKCIDGLMYIEQPDNPTERILVQHPTIAGAPLTCPICNSKSRAFGTKINVKPPRGDAGFDIIENLLSYVNPDVNILEYKETSIEKLEEKIFNDIVGITENLNNNKQNNELSVMSSYESRKETLKYWKQCAEYSYKFYTETLIKFEYETYLHTEINLGSKFYFLTENELLEKIEKTDNLSLDSLLEYREQLISNKFNFDAIGKQRAKLILECEKRLKPFNYINKNELIKLGRISDKDFYINLNFEMLFCNFEKAMYPLTIHDYLQTKDTEDFIADFRNYLETINTTGNE